MAQLTIQQAFDQALQHHAAGRLQEAEQLYRQILAQQPAHVDAKHLLGVIAHQAGRNDIAIDLIRQAITLNPDYAEAHSNLGQALKDQGQLDEAIAAFRRAIALKPELPEAHSNLGNALREKGQLDEAIAACEQAIRLRPGYADAYNNLGNALKDKGQLDDAIAAYRHAITLKSDYPEAHSNLGNALREKGELDEAVAACERAITLKPGYPEAHCNLGNALKDQGQLDEAIATYRRAIALNSNFPEAHSGLGVALKDKGELDEAVAAFRQAIVLRPDYPEAHNNLGNALKDKGELDEAIAAFRRAIALRPRYAEAHSNLIYTLQYHPGYDSQSIAEEYRRWNRQHAEPLRKFIQPHTNNRDPDRRLRIGYVSADFRNHASAYFLLPLLKHHDPRQVELFCFAQVVRSDAMTLQFQQRANAWRNTVGVSDDQIARQIREDQIDILVDLKMHTAENRLLVFARKPAPVQATWLGYPGSTGLTAIDVRLSDPYLDPPGMDESTYSERTIRLPDTFWCYDPLDGGEIPVNSLPALQTGVITFGCLNNFCKINDGLLSLWAQIMRQVKGSRLLLLAPEGSHRQRTLERLGHEGIDQGRIEFVVLQSRQKYLETYHRIDLVLDTFPYNGHTTSLDSLWMGVPVVTQVGSRPVARGGWSQLSNLGLGELAGETAEQFVRLAVELAKDLPRLEQLRSTLRPRMQQSPLMDAPRFARNIEAAYRHMWRTWCETVSSR
jgi:predicted O-linked N-acetylglucosamine transferase (SPINDLY family)